MELAVVLRSKSIRKPRYVHQRLAGGWTYPDLGLVDAGGVGLYHVSRGFRASE
jgi:hypothetical protein